MRILLVEDDETLADAVVEILREEHYAVDHAGDAESADFSAHVNEYDLVVLDWSLPDGSGIELLRKWREDGMPGLTMTTKAAPL